MNTWNKKGQSSVFSYGHDAQPCRISFSNSQKPKRKSPKTESSGCGWNQLVLIKSSKRYRIQHFLSLGPDPTRCAWLYTIGITHTEIWCSLPRSSYVLWICWSSRGESVLMSRIAVVVWPQTLASVRKTMPGRSTSGFHRPGRYFLHQARSAVRCWASRMKVELHPTKKRFWGRLFGKWMTASNELICFLL